MRSNKDKCNFAISMASIWTIVFAVTMTCFIKWGNIFAAICMVFSYFKSISYAHDAGFFEAHYKALERFEMASAAMASRESINNNQTKSVHEDNCD